MATPRYRVARKTFIEPWIVQPESVIETNGPAGDHLIPLNDEAKAKMEEFYETKVDIKDEDGKVIRTVYPNRSKRPFDPGAPGVHHEVTLISDPPPDDTKFVESPTQERITSNPTAGPLMPAEPYSPLKAPAEPTADGTNIISAAPEKKV